MLWLILIFLLFWCINYLLNRETFDSTDGIVDTDITDYVSLHYDDICNPRYPPFSYFKKKRERKQNRRKKIIKIIEDQLIPTEEIYYINNCAHEDQKCLVDEKGQNTCCGDLQCVRRSKDFGYKVCSKKEDACGKNSFSFTTLHNMFTFNVFEDILDDDWWVSFIESVGTKHYIGEEEEGEGEEEPSLTDYGVEELNALRDEIKEKTKKLCGGKELNNELFNHYIRDEIIKIFQKSEVFAGMIFGASKDIVRKSSQIAFGGKQFSLSNYGRSCN